MPPATSLAARIDQMHAGGATYQEIADALGGMVTAGAVWGRTTRALPRGKVDDCHGTCGRWVSPYRMGDQLVKPPDHCGACARAISRQAIREEAQHVRDFLSRAIQASEEMSAIP